MGAKQKGADPPLKRNAAIRRRCPPTALPLPLLWGDFGTSPGSSGQRYTTLRCGGKGIALGAAPGWQVLLSPLVRQGDISSEPTRQPCDHDQRGQGCVAPEWFEDGLGMPARLAEAEQRGPERLGGFVRHRSRRRRVTLALIAASTWLFRACNLEIGIVLRATAALSVQRVTIPNRLGCCRTLRRINRPRTSGDTARNTFFTGKLYLCNCIQFDHLTPPKITRKPPFHIHRLLCARTWSVSEMPGTTARPAATAARFMGT